MVRSTIQPGAISSYLGHSLIRGDAGGYRLRALQEEAWVQDWRTALDRAIAWARPVAAAPKGWRAANFEELSRLDATVATDSGPR